MNCSSGFSVSYVLLSKSLFWFLQFGFSGFICFGLFLRLLQFISLIRWVWQLPIWLTAILRRRGLS